MEKPTFKAILLDFGNVIIPIDFSLTFEAFARISRKSPETIQKLFAETEVIRRYESGIFADDEFREIVRQVIGFPFNDAEIDEAWNALLLQIPAERVERIQELKQRYPVYLLSNTNPLHIAACDKQFQRRFGMKSAASLFTHAFYSYDMGLWKPDLAIYEQVLIETNLEPQDVIFLDDLAKNIEAAAKVGLQVAHVTPERGMLDILAPY